MRIDSHHAYSEQYSLEYLESILRRNRFEGSVLVPQPARPLPNGRGSVGGTEPRPLGSGLQIPTFVKGVILDAGAPRHPQQVGLIHDFATGDLPNLPHEDLPLDVLHGLHHIPEVAKRYPNLRIAIVHLGFPPDDNWPQAIERAAGFPQVFCKLSGLTRFADPRPYVRHALAVFGPQRLMFGSDWPYGLPEHTWKANLALFTQSIGAQPIEVREELLGGTASRFYAI